VTTFLTITNKLKQIQIPFSISNYQARQILTQYSPQTIMLCTKIYMLSLLVSSIYTDSRGYFSLTLPNWNIESDMYWPATSICPNNRRC